MLSLERVSRQGLNPYMRPIANLLSRLAPTAALVATDKNALYPHIQQIWDHGAWHPPIARGGGGGERAGRWVCGGGGAAPVWAAGQHHTGPSYVAADPLTCKSKTRVRNASEYLRATEQTMAQLEDADFPFLVFHSGGWVRTVV